jgi:hypothetical protein
MIKNVFERDEVLVEAGNLSNDDEDVEEVRRCEICNSVLNEEEKYESICNNCKASILLNENIEPTFGVDL